MGGMERTVYLAVIVGLFIINVVSAGPNDISETRRDIDYLKGVNAGMHYARCTLRTNARPGACAIEEAALFARPSDEEMESF